MPHTETTDELRPTVFVLYGATGDLAHRMVLPAIFELAQKGLLPQDWRLIGSGRGERSDEEFGPRPEEGPWEEFRGRLHFAGGGFTAENPGQLLDAVATARKELGDDAQLIHYLSLPPKAFTEYTRALGAHGLAQGARVVYEKPFGASPEGFRELDDLVHSVMDEEQVFRIDHFLGKEGTQDLHVLRFANALFEHVWSREHVAQV